MGHAVYNEGEAKTEINNELSESFFLSLPLSTLVQLPLGLFWGIVGEIEDKGLDFFPSPRSDQSDKSFHLIGPREAGFLALLLVFAGQFNF